jgi:hypothetical protein
MLGLGNWGNVVMVRWGKDGRVEGWNWNGMMEWGSEGMGGWGNSGGILYSTFFNFAVFALLI